MIILVKNQKLSKVTISQKINQKFSKVTNSQKFNQTLSKVTISQKFNQKISKVTNSQKSHLFRLLYSPKHMTKMRLMLNSIIITPDWTALLKTAAKKNIKRSVRQYWVFSDKKHVWALVSLTKVQANPDEKKLWNNKIYNDAVFYKGPNFCAKFDFLNEFLQTTSFISF